MSLLRAGILNWKWEPEEKTRNEVLGPALTFTWKPRNGTLPQRLPAGPIHPALLAQAIHPKIAMIAFPVRHGGTRGRQGAKTRGLVCPGRQITKVLFFESSVRGKSGGT
jgi:hypothetical protein